MRSLVLRLSCDKCGGEPAETAVLAFEGEPFEVDLCGTHRDDLLALVTAGRKPGTPLAMPEGVQAAVPAVQVPAQAPAPSTRASGAAVAKRHRPGVMDWAKAQAPLNYSHGKPPNYVMAAYDQFYPGDVPADFVAPERKARCEPCGLGFLDEWNLRRHNTRLHPVASPEPASTAQAARESDTEPSPQKTWTAPGKHKPAKEPQPSLFPAVLVPQPKPREFWPTGASITAMQATGASWPALVDELHDAIATTPSNRPNVDTVYTAHWKALVAKDGHVIGLVERNAEDLPPSVQVPAKRIERKGKRGGIGNVKPKTTDEVIALVEATPGWTWDYAKNGHLDIRGPEGQRAQIANTASDHRTGRNDFTRLRRLGLAAG